MLLFPSETKERRDRQYIVIALRFPWTVWFRRNLRVRRVLQSWQCGAGRAGRGGGGGGSLLGVLLGRGRLALGVVGDLRLLALRLAVLVVLVLKGKGRGWNTFGTITARAKHILTTRPSTSL